MLKGLKEVSRFYGYSPFAERRDCARGDWLIIMTKTDQGFEVPSETGKSASPVTKEVWFNMLSKVMELNRDSQIHTNLTLYVIDNSQNL